CGPVRSPLLDLTADEERQLVALMQVCKMPVAEMA
ncbi:MAG: 5-dehydro-4-deoxyglucarate dehydratase, partial [Mesorhizobium sp.]